MEKKEGKDNGVLKFFETLILIALIGSVIMIVFETYYDQIDGEDGTYEDYDYYDYSYDDYDYYDDYYSDLYYEEPENTSVSNFVSIEDFMNSETGKNFLREPNSNLVSSNEVEVQNIVENKIEDTSDNFTPDVEELYNYYDEQKSMKEKFEEQKKKIEIKDEGKSINNEIIASIKNNNDEFVYDLTLNTIFYKANKIVSIDVQEINVIDANNIKYIKVSEIPEDYDGYEFLISKRYYMEYFNELLNDDVTFSSNDDEGYVNISVQNKSSKKINRIHFTILYFDSRGNLLDFENVQEYSIRAKKTSRLMGYGIWDEKNTNYLNFADYKVILDYAENYGY